MKMQLVCRRAIARKRLISAGMRCSAARMKNTKKLHTHLPDSFLTIFLNERTTPYTSFASSSNGSPVGCCCCASVVEVGGGVDRAGFSLEATTIPVDDDRVFRGLLKADTLTLTFSAIVAGEIARETAGSRLPSTAGRGRFVRCQS